MKYLQKLFLAQRYMLRFMWKNDRSLFFLMFFVSIAESISAPMFVGLAGRLMTVLENGTNIVTAMIYIGELIGWGFGIRLLILCMQRRGHWKKIELNERLSLELFEKTCNMDLAIWENPDVQTLYQEADSATSNNRCAKIIESGFSIVSAVVSIILTAAIMVSVEPWVFVVFSAIIALKTISVVRTKQQKYRNWKMDRELQKEFSYHINLLFDDECTQEMRMTGLSGWFRRKYVGVADRARKIEERETTVISHNKYIDNLLNHVHQFTLYFFLAYKVVFKSLSLAEFTVFFTGLNEMSENVELFISSVLEAGENAVYLTAYIKYMDIENQIAVKHSSDLHCTSATFNNKKLTITCVDFRYPANESFVLKDLDLTLDLGKFYMIVGENGAGKSTFIKLLCRLYDPTNGRICIDEQDIRSYDYQEYRNNIGIVFQDYMTYEYSVGENIAMDEWDDSNPPEQRVWQVLEQVGLADRIRSLPNGLYTPLGRSFSSDGVRLSGGESQKIALAKAIYKDRSILILDEPSSALDAIAENDLIDHFFKIKEQRTVFYISHRLSAARRADCILFFNNGTISAVGTHEELLHTCSAYAKMYHAQAKHYQ